MDDEKEYQELLKAEAQEQRDTKMVMKAFKIIMLLIAVGLLIGISGQLVLLLKEFL